MTSSRTDTRRRALVSGLCFVAALLSTRLVLLRDASAIASPDSPGYASIALSLAAGNLFHPALGELRLPGYPLLLAVLDRTVGLTSTTVVWAQTLLGLVGAACALRIVFVAGGGFRPGLVALLLGLQPLFLFFEHWWMSEALFVTCCLVATWLAAETRFAPRTFLEGAALGGAAAAIALIRPNGVAVVATGAAFLALPFLVPAAHSGSARRRSAAGLAGCVLVFALWMGAWLARNHLAFGSPSYLLGGEQSRLAYSVLLGTAPDTARTAEVLGPAYDPQNPASVYRVLAAERRRGPVEAEAWARDKRVALGATDEGRIRRARMRVLAHFFGIDESGRTMRNLSNSIRRAWIDPDPAFFERMRRSQFWSRHGLKVPHSHLATRTAGRLGELYLDWGRLSIYLAFFVLAGLHCRRTRFRAPDPSGRLLLFLATAAAATAALHSWHLADLDRFAVSFDWLPLLGVAILLGRFRESRRASSLP